jgi:putative transposase
LRVDYSSLNRWVLKYTPVLDQVFRQRKRPVGASWRMDETYIVDFQFRDLRAKAATDVDSLGTCAEVTRTCQRVDDRALSEKSGRREGGYA